MRRKWDRGSVSEEQVLECWWLQLFNDQCQWHVAALLSSQTTQASKDLRCKASWLGWWNCRLMGTWRHVTMFFQHYFDTFDSFTGLGAYRFQEAYSSTTTMAVGRFSLHPPCQCPPIVRLHSRREIAMWRLRYSQARCDTEEGLWCTCAHRMKYTRNKVMHVHRINRSREHKIELQATQ